MFKVCAFMYVLVESDSEDTSKGRSPHYSSDSYPRPNRSPRPQKYNFNLGTSATILKGVALHIY